MGYDVLRRARFLLLLTIVLALLVAPSAPADPPPANSVWTEAYIDEPDGTQLHADILRPKNLPKDAKTPVILSIGPYFNHSGQVGPAGPVEGTSYSPAGGAGPSGRFADFVEGAKLMERGYTYVMVDLRGFGGSSGCLDWAGPGEQADVKAAVEWAAKQPWSTGKVGMYGKSYDGVTGLIGVGVRPKGLSAVVAQEPVYDLYRYLYENNVRFVNSLATPALYDAIAETPGAVPGDSPQYQQNAFNDSARPGCPARNWADQQDSNHASDFWKPRNLATKAKGSKIPLFMTQGFLEDNTKPDPSAWEFFNGLAGPKRAWFGMWDHVRGNEVDTATGRLKEGRAGFFDEVMRFYDQYLKGQKPPVADPALAVETSDGTWRAETQWPPADARDVTIMLKTGAYTDHGQNNGTEQGYPPTGDGVWTFSPKLSYDVHLAGVPRVDLKVQTQASNANLVVDVYDLDQSNNATLITRGAYLVPQSGHVSYQLYGDDWIIKRHHRIGVLITSSNAEWWMHQPSGQNVSVTAAQLSLPFLACARTQTIEGDPSMKLESYKKSAPISVALAAVESRTDPGFALPPAMAPCTNAKGKLLGVKVKSRRKAKSKHTARRHSKRAHKKGRRG